MQATAKKLGISKRTLQLHLQQVRLLDSSLYQLVIKKQKSNQIKGRILGGKAGKRKPSITDKETYDLANLIISKQYTYQEAGQETGIPSSTIYDRTHSKTIDSETKNLLSMVAVANKKNMTTEEYQERHQKK